MQVWGVAWQDSGSHLASVSDDKSVAIYSFSYSRGRLRVAQRVHTRLASIPAALGLCTACCEFVPACMTAWLGRKACSFRLVRGCVMCCQAGQSPACALHSASCAGLQTVPVLYWPVSINPSPSLVKCALAASCRLGGRLGQGASELNVGRPAVTKGPLRAPTSPI